jgi:membrane protease YdiL (CAAX protease family)
MLTRQLLTYFLLAYSISWLIWLPLYGSAFGLERPLHIPFNHALGGLGPLIASVLTTWMFAGRAGLKQLFSKMVALPRARFFLAALLVPAVLLLIALLADAAMNGTSVNLNGMFRPKEFPQMSYIAFFFYNLVFFGFGEEAGWRGFALPRLQAKANALTSALVLTVFWALWHLPLFLYRPGYTSMDIGGTAGWIFSLLTGSLLLSWLYNSTRGSILVCAVFHTTIDLAFTSDARGADTVSLLGMMITLWGVIVLLVYKPRHLSVHGRFSLPSSDQ